MTTQAEAVRSSSEVPEKARRRRFNAEFKQRILREADACTKAGELGALLRREGLYFFHPRRLARRRARPRAEGAGSSKRGPQPRPPAGKKDRKRIEQLERENLDHCRREPSAPRPWLISKKKWQRCLAGL